MKKVELKNITKIYNKSTIAVDNVSFSVDRGQFLILLGASGCGKSSILKMVAGLEEINAGELYFDDILMNDIIPEKRNIGMVFQNYALYPHLSVYENLAFPLKIMKMKSSEIRKQVIDISELIGLEEYLLRKPKQLSGGQRQRVALGRALIKRPDIFLFDEPLSNLDAKLRVQMRTEIINLHKKAGTTSIYVTHDQTEAMTMGDILVILADGKILQNDTPENIYKKPNNIAVASFIGSPQMNFFVGKIVHDNGLIFLFRDIDNFIKIRGNVYDSLIGQEITLGIRPENLMISDNNKYDKYFEVINDEFLGYQNIIHFEDKIIKGSLLLNHNKVESMINKIGLEVNSEFMHIFDSNGDRIDK